MNGHDYPELFAPPDDWRDDDPPPPDDDIEHWLNLPAPEPPYGACLECANPPQLEEIEYGQLVCPDCGADWFCRDYYDECRAECEWDGYARCYRVVVQC